MTTTPSEMMPRAYWFVGAAYGADDQTQRFLDNGIWENGYTDKYLDLVKSIQPGDRIAIKSTYTRKRDLPFDNRGQAVSVMAIKATGIVTENLGDGRTVRVTWTPLAELSASINRSEGIPGSFTLVIWCIQAK